ncbi:MAG: hypothetical protein ACOCP4_01455 [Candidatus Woesearchaeota archaeon]
MDFYEAYENLKSKFTNGNERNVITAEEWNALKEYIDKKLEGDERKLKYIIRRSSSIR